MKRLLVVAVVVVLALGALAFMWASRRAVPLVEARVEAAFGRPAVFEGARWVWPAGLEIDRIALPGAEPFSRADILVVEGVSVRLGPFALLTGTVEATSVTVGDLLVRIHHEDDAIIHPLSRPDSTEDVRVDWTDHVSSLRIETGTVEFYDHDAPLYFEGDDLRQRFEARLQDLSVDVGSDDSGDIQYRVNGQLDLGPNRPASPVTFTATTDAGTGETKAELQVDGVPLTAFNLYLEQVITGLDDGRMTIRSNTEAIGSVWTTNAQVNLTRLSLRPPQPNGAPAPGPNSSSLLSLFADPSGASSLDVAFTWDRDSPNVTFQQALGQGIQMAVQQRMMASAPSLLGGLLGGLLEGQNQRPSGDQSPVDGLAAFGALIEGLAGANQQR